MKRILNEEIEDLNYFREKVCNVLKFSELGSNQRRLVKYVGARKSLYQLLNMIESTAIKNNIEVMKYEN
jgi:hypothetical protein